ncbi:MAG: DMT family transporter [Lachnospiraceae bacterium]|nr:DMT family transporter [Lachnospiraceae bacterium]
MSWFLFALICVIGWGCADLFYKKGSDESDKYSHLKIAVWVGLVMGVCSFILMPFAESKMGIGTLVSNAVKYTPASISYIVSMVIGYAGLRYLELSIVSPIQNASGAMSAICMLIFFIVTGRITDIGEEFSTLSWVGVAFIVVGVMALAIVEKKLSAAEEAKVEKKYKYGALALLFPLMYCLFDTIGTAADGIILDEETGLGLGEIDVMVLYGLTFLLAGIVSYIFLWIKTGKPYNPFAKSEWFKGIAACCEEFGQMFYVYAMAKEPVLAAPMVASYCIISVILSRIFVKEKLKASQYACVASVIIGIVILGIVDGLAEM